MNLGRFGTALAAFLLAATAGCTGGSPEPTAAAESPPSQPPSQPARQSDAPLTEVNSYVSLGDSYVSGPGINTVEPESKDCRRSDRNWPTLLSARLGAKTFRDVSCAGARTRHLIASYQFQDGTPVPAQIDAVSKDTELVTLGIGGNDEGVFAGLLGSCSSAINADQDVCTPYIRDKLPTSLERVERSIARVIGSVRRKAPGARVILVGYLRVLPDRGGCAAVGVSGNEATQAVRGEKALDDTLAAAAGKAGVDFLSLREGSTGHDVCSGDPWVNGIVPAAGDGIILHPNAAGMRAVAAAVVERLEPVS